MTGSLKLSDHPADLVRLACDRCGRAGQYRNQNLIAEFGPDIPLPYLRVEIAKCERRGKDARCLRCALRRAGLASDGDRRCRTYGYIQQKLHSGYGN
jgi:hypothetical protein